MDLKPIKESKKNFYPTISEANQSSFIKKMVLSTIAGNDIPSIMAVYAPSYITVRIFGFVRVASFFTTVLFLFLLIKDIIKMKKDTNQDTEVTNKIKEHIKINLIFLIITIIVMIATVIGNIYK